MIITNSRLIVLVFFKLTHIQINAIRSHNSKVVDLCDLTTDQFITLYGYTSEVHKVTTQDGYILTVFRCNSKRFSTEKRKSVIIQHGILSSSDDFCQNNSNQSLAYVLADANYDVWLMNSRGNTYSRHHISKNPDNSSSGFWQFSWYEIGIYDNAAVIDYVLGQTNTSKVYYIGFSQATTTLMVLLSERPEYNDKLYAASLLAPIGYLQSLNFLSKYLKWLPLLTTIFQNREFSPRSHSVSKLITGICVSNMVICKSLVNLVFGPSDNHWNFTMFPSYLCHYTSGASSNQFLHYAQEIRYGYFGKYMINRAEIPSDFSLSQITTPVSLHFSSSDRLVSVHDVNQLISKMKNVVYVQYINQIKFNHVDYHLDTRLFSILYSKILRVFQSYH